MTAEQILEKHLLLMIGRTDQSYASIEEMKKQPEWQTTINAMLEYAEQQALSQHDVIKSVCDQCRFENECRFKAENIEQNCKFFIDKQTVL